MRAEHQTAALTNEREQQGNERGDTTIQAVAIIPLALLLIFAIVQFAVAWYAKAALTAAAQDGLRYTQTNPTRSPEPSTLLSARSNAGFVDGLTVTSSRPTANRITVTIRGQVPAAFPGFRWTITGTASGPLELFRPQGQ
jgi:Flp pilus assembly protein TadG